MTDEASLKCNLFPGARAFLVGFLLVVSPGCSAATKESHGDTSIYQTSDWVIPVISSVGVLFVATFGLVFRGLAKRLASQTPAEKAQAFKGMSDQDIRTGKKLALGCGLSIVGFLCFAFGILVYSRQQERVVVDSEHFESNGLGRSKTVLFRDVASMVIREVAPRANERTARDIPSYYLRCTMKDQKIVDVPMNGPAMHAAIREVLERAHTAGVVIRQSDLAHKPKEWQFGQ